MSPLDPPLPRSAAVLSQDQAEVRTQTPSQWETQRSPLTVQEPHVIRGSSRHDMGVGGKQHFVVCIYVVGSGPARSQLVDLGSGARDQRSRRRRQVKVAGQHRSRDHDAFRLHYKGGSWWVCGITLVPESKVVAG